ncbi:MAG: LptE family protein [Candidatus Aadella gelida]|nr:LptE family protein [Candidatus Aadella gelida]
MNKIAISVMIACMTLIGGCGYTTGTLLPPELDSIHVENLTNSVDITQEVSDRRSSYSYRPGLEIDITRAVIDEFIFDGNLTVKNADKSALTLKGALKDFRQYPLSYDGGDNVEEFRIELLVDIKLVNDLTGETMWKEKGFMGQSNYTISGPNSQTESAALNSAVKDIAQRIVERTVEAW